MRLDKFLKVSRLIKRRTIAKEVCDGGRVEINGRPAKAGALVKPGDVLSIRFGERGMKVEIVDTPNSIPAGDAKNLYQILE